jgi:hypothetical protein
MLIGRPFSRERGRVRAPERQERFGLLFRAFNKFNGFGCMYAIRFADL